VTARSPTNLGEYRAPELWIAKAISLAFEWHGTDLCTMSASPTYRGPKQNYPTGPIPGGIERLVGRRFHVSVGRELIHVGRMDPDVWIRICWVAAGRMLTIHRQVSTIDHGHAEHHARSILQRLVAHYEDTE